MLINNHVQMHIQLTHCSSLTSLALACSASADHEMTTSLGVDLGTKLQGSVMLSPLAYS